MATINFEEKWAIMQDGVNKLIDFLDQKGKKPYNHEEYSTLYATVFTLCTSKVDTGKSSQNPTELLYERYKKCIQNYLQERVVPSLKQKQGEILLIEMVHRWRDHQLVIRWMQKLFSYLVS
jgi:cullin 1